MLRSQDHPQQQLQLSQPQQEQSHSGQDECNFAPATAARPSRAVSSWEVTYLLQSARRGWQRHRSPHVVSLDAANKCLEVSDAATSRLQERVVLTAAGAVEDVHVAFVAAAGGQNIIRFTLAGQPERKFALIADNKRGATELCEALDREGVTVQGMEDLPDAVFLRGRDSRTSQALDAAIPSLSRPEVQAYVVRLLFQDSFRQFVGDLSEMFAHVQAPLPAPPQPPSPIPAMTTTLAPPAREDGGRVSSLGGKQTDKTVRLGERGGAHGDGASGICGGGGGRGGGTSLHDNGPGGDLQGSGSGVGGVETSLAGEGVESNSVAMAGGEEQGEEGAAACSGGTSAVGAGDGSGRKCASGKGEGRAQAAGGGAGRGARGGKNGEPRRKVGKGRGGGGARANATPSGVGGSSGGGGESGNATVGGRKRINPGLRSVQYAAPEHRKRSPTTTSPAGLSAGPRTKTTADFADASTASDATGRGARPPPKRARTHDRQGHRKEMAAGGGDDCAGSSDPAPCATEAGADAVAVAAAASGRRRQGASSGPPLPARAATSSGRAPGLCATLTKIWSRVNKHPASWAFSMPVDLAKAPGYLDIVKHPIDLESIRSRLDGPTVHYTTGEMLHDDLVLMCRNAMLYNEEGDVYHRAAVELLPFIESIFAH